MLIFLVLLLACSQDWTCNLQMIVALEAQGINHYNHYAVCSAVWAPEFDKHLKKAGGHISRNVLNITINMTTIVRKPWMIKLIKFPLRNSDN